MPKLLTIAILILTLTLATAACASGDSADVSDETLTEHMVAEATLTAHYIDAALKAGMMPEEINATLARIAGATVIDEFWVSDESGAVAFTNVAGLDFTFPTDPNGGTQAAPFAHLLLGSKDVVAQEAQPRESDGALFQYVGVAGVDRPRIVQVGFDRR